LWRSVGNQSLYRLPDSRNACFVIREFLDRLQICEWSDTREAVPDFDQAVGGPGTRKFAEFPGGAEVFGGVDLGGSGFLLRSKDRDVVCRVDCEGAHH
jgi:hypothetical protein